MLVVHSGALMPHLPPPPDPATVLLIHPDAVEGIVDRSQYAHTLTIVSMTHNNLDPSPSQDESMVSTNTATSKVEAGPAATLAKTAGQAFTLEFSVNFDPESPLGTVYGMAFDSGRYHTFQAIGGNLFRTQYTEAAGFSYGDLTGGQWYQLAITYDGTTWRNFVNGVKVAEATGLSQSVASPAAFGLFGVPFADYLPRLNARVAEVRLTLGQARYTANYTPATTPFPNPSAP